jgi:Ni,Fe-hydrogenase I large subunit
MPRDREQPIEILRTIYGFGSCIARAVHVAGPDGQRLAIANLAADSSNIAPR